MTKGRQTETGGMNVRSFQRPPRLEPTDFAHWFGGSAGEAARALRDLSIANRYFGGTGSLLYPLRELLASHQGPPPRLLDVGCGSADTPRALVRWARRHGLDLHVVGVDQDREAVSRAIAASRSFPEIRILQGDARRLPFGPTSFDYVFSSMLLHYFSSDEAPALLRSWAILASRAVIVNDIERHWFPCLAISILARMSKSSLFREGSRRTVLRGFAPEEMARLAARAGFTTFRVRRYFPFRLTLVARRDDLGAGGPAFRSR